MKKKIQGSISAVCQNGFIAEHKSLEKECRQDDAASPYVFVNCAEILEIAIREN